MKRLGFQYEALLKMNDAHALDEERRDILIYAWLSPAGLPPLDVNW